MRKFNLQQYRQNPTIPLVLEHYQLNGEIWPIEEAQIVFNSKLAIKVPTTGYSTSDIQLVEDDQIRDIDNNLVGYIRFAQDEEHLQSLAVRAYNMEPDEEIHFKTHPDSDLWAITRIKKYECETLYLCYYGGGNMTIYDCYYSENTPEDIQKWITETIETDQDYIYPIHIQNNTLTKFHQQNNGK